MFFTNFTKEIIATGVILILIIILRLIIARLVRRYAKSSAIIEYRTNLVIKYIHLLINILATIGFAAF